MGESLKKLFGLLTKIVGFATIIVLALLFINAQFNIIKNVKVLEIFAYIKEYAVLATVGLAALAFAADKGLIIFVITAALVALVIIFSFLPNVQNIIINYIK